MPPGRLDEGPGLGRRWPGLGPSMSRVQSSWEPFAVSVMLRRDTDDGQSVRIEELVSPTVAGASLLPSMARAVGLDHQAGRRVEEIGDAEQSTGEIEDGSVHRERTDGKFHDDDKASSRFPRARRTFRRQLERRSCDPDAACLVMAIDESPYRRQRCAAAVGDAADRHVEDHDGLGDVGCTAHLVVCGASDDGGQIVVDLGHLTGQEHGARWLDPWTFAHPMPLAHVKQDRTLVAEAIDAVDVRDAAEIERGPSADAAAGRQERNGIENACERMGLVFTGDAGQAVVRVAPMRLAQLVRAQAGVEEIADTGGVFWFSI